MEVQVETAVSTQSVSRKEKSSSGRKATTDVIANQPAPIVPTQSITSREVAGTPASSTSSTCHYVIPKKGIQTNRLNELALKVSPPARPILPKPPRLGRTSLPRNISGNRSTQGQKKKK